MTKHNRALSQYLETPEPGSLAGLLQHVAFLQRLAPLLTEALPDVLAAHCQIANYRQGRLIISVSNQAIATRLRFILPDLRQQLRRHQAFAGLVGIDFYITKPTPSPNASTPTLPHQRKHTQGMQAAADPTHDIADKALRERWLRLLQHVSESSL